MPDPVDADSEIERVADSFLHSFVQRDWQALQTLIAEQAAWSMPGTGVLSGTVIGPAALVGRARSIAAAGVHTEFRLALVGQHGVALILHNTATSPVDRHLDEDLATVLTIRDGRIHAIDTYLSDVAGKKSVLRLSQASVAAHP